MKLKWPFISQQRDREMTAEMNFHIESKTRELVDAGMTEADARLEARRRFGSMLKQKEAGHEIRNGRFFEAVLRDAKHMSRGLRRTPGFTIAVVLTLALGIGANTAIFSVVDQVLLRPLPYPDGDNLVMAYEQSKSENSVSPANWLDWQRESQTFEGFAVWMMRRNTLTGVGEATQVRVQVVSHEFFSVLGVRPMLGGPITEDGDRPDAQLEAVLTSRLWQSRFEGDPNIVGRLIELDDRPHLVVGVMPPGFRFVYEDVDVWTTAQLDRARSWRETNDGRFINVVGRVRAATDLETARVDMDRIGRRLAAMHDFNRNTSVNLVPLREVLTGTVESSLLILYLAVGVLLAIACFNIANLLIARAGSRRQEIAVRSSLGADRAAIVRQLLVESLMLALAGGALGIGLAYWSLDALLAFAPPNLLGVPDLRIDTRVLAYVAGLSVLTGLTAGLVPSFIVARRSVVSSLSANNSRVTHSPRIRQTLVVAQVAMTVILLCGAGLLVRTVVALNNVNHGFEPKGLVTMRLALSQTRYPAERANVFFRNALRAIRELPGVESAAAGTSLPAVGAPRAGTRFHIQSTPMVARSELPSATIRVATPGYFRTLQIPVLRGREFTDADDANPAPGFVVNEAFVKLRLAGLDPLRESLMVRMQDDNPYAPIIGVVGDTSDRSVKGEVRPTIYYSHRQLTDTTMTLFVRSNQPSAAAQAVVGVVRRLDPNVPVTNIRTFEEALAERLAQERLSAFVSGAFALSGLLLASLGLYALLAFLVTERTREIGLRIALGAQRAELTRSVVKDGLHLVVIGAVTGVALSFVVLPRFETVLFGVSPNDAATYTGVVALLTVVAGLASYKSRAPGRSSGALGGLTAGIELRRETQMTVRPPSFVRRLLAFVTFGARDREMQQEMAFHMESLKRDHMRAGMSESAAELAARRRFGSSLRHKEQGHEVRTGRLIADVARDVRQTGRSLRRSPGFATAVILTLALGIGGNTAIFSVVDQLMLRPLPYPNGDELLTVYESYTAGTLGVGTNNFVSPANWFDWQRESRTLQGLAAWRTGTATLTGVGDATQLNTQAVSAEFFPLLSVTPLLGRTFSEEDDRPKARPTVVLSHQLWQRRFAGDPNVVGRFIQLNDRPAEVIGVMPKDFRFIYQDNDLWRAYQLDRNTRYREHSGRFINVVARLKRDTTIAEARADMESLARRLAAMHVFNKNATVKLVPLREELTGEVSTALMVLYAAVAVLLTIACFNVANLLLARAASRRREMAIRTSLGAGRLAIVRQLLVESVLLAVAGGVLGIAIARWTLDAVLALAPVDLLRVPELSIDRRVLLYALGLSLLTGVGAGLIPAVLVASRSIAASLRTTSSNVTHSPRVRQALVVCQVAMTVLLLCGAGLLVRTVLALNGINHGFDTHNLLTMQIGLSGNRYDGDRAVTFYRQASAELRALPGVESVAGANSLAVIGSPRAGSWFHRRGTPELPRGQRPLAMIRVVTPGYFRTLRIPVLQGREFTQADDANPAPGFVVNQAFAKKFLGGVDPLREVMTVWMQEENPYAPIIGVVGDVSEGSVRDNPQPTVFYSHRQLQETGMTLFVRSANPTATAAGAVNAIRRLDPNVPITKIGTFDGALAESLARERLSALVSGGFALSGLLLASLGLYGLLAFLVAERTKEIGLRVALGAQRTHLTWSVVSGGLRLVALGAAIGVSASLILLPWFGTLLFGVTPNDLSTYAIVLVLLGIVAGLASYVPARRAALIEPMIALRGD